jgi:hypothetical protein
MVFFGGGVVVAQHILHCEQDSDVVAGGILMAKNDAKDIIESLNQHVCVSFRHLIRIQFIIFGLSCRGGHWKNAPPPPGKNYRFFGNGHCIGFIGRVSPPTKNLATKVHQRNTSERKLNLSNK